MTLFVPEDGGDGKKDPLPPPCVHHMVEVDFAGGITVHASRHHSSRDEDEKHPDIGWYLDTIWRPDCIAYYTYWPDFLTPTLDMDVFVEQLRLIYDAADEGKVVEVGCIGGHGRTGTALACLAVYAGIDPIEAIDHIREVYCQKAIETEVQEWWVTAVHAHLNDYEPPEMPAPPVFKSSTGTNAYGGYESYDWSQGKTKMDAHKGEHGKLNVDAGGQYYCSLCLVDCKLTDMECEWCGCILTLRGDD